MNPYVDKFKATTKAYLQVVAGMTDTSKVQAHISAARSRVVPCAILGGPSGRFQNNIATQAGENSAIAYDGPVVVG